MISKELFIKVIGSLRDQADRDYEIAEMLGNVHRSDINPYDNSCLVDSIFLILGEYFPISEIKDFCYELDYGRSLVSDDAIGEFYNRLNPIVSTHPLIDDFEGFDFRTFDLKPLNETGVGSFSGDTTLRNEEIPNYFDLEVTYMIVSPIKKSLIEKHIEEDEKH